MITSANILKVLADLRFYMLNYDGDYYIYESLVEEGLKVRKRLAIETDEIEADARLKTLKADFIRELQKTIIIKGKK